MPSVLVESPESRLYRRSPEFLVPIPNITAVVFVFDSNLLTKLRRPPRGKGELGQLLSLIQGTGKSGLTRVALLTGIAELQYRREGSTPATILGWRDMWMAEHFRPFEVKAFELFEEIGGLSPFKSVQATFELVLRNYLVIDAAHQALTKYQLKSQRESVVHQFLENLSRTAPAAMVHLAIDAVGSALCGNRAAFTALHLQDPPNDRMNGSWDLIHWLTYAHLFLCSDRTLVHPNFISFDKNAADLFTDLKVDVLDNVWTKFVPEDHRARHYLEILAAGRAQIPTLDLSDSQLLESLSKVPETSQGDAFHAAIRMVM